MSDRIGEQILVESYKVLYDYIAMNESEDTKFDLKIKTFQKIEETIREEAKSKQKTFRDLEMKYGREKLMAPVVILNSMSDLYSFYRDNKNDALELMKMISSNDVDGIKDGGYTRSKGAYLIDNVGDFCRIGSLTLLNTTAIDEDMLDNDKYKEFLLRAFPAWAKSAKRIFSLLPFYINHFDGLKD